MEMKDRIKKLRMDAGLTQEELAEKLGLQKSAVAKWENGRVFNLKRSTILKMADLFGCAPSYLMAMEEDDESKAPYYLTPETAALAQQYFDDPNYRVLFDAAKDSKPEDLQMAADLLRRLKETRNG